MLSRCSGFQEIALFTINLTLQSQRANCREDGKRALSTENFEATIENIMKIMVFISQCAGSTQSKIMKFVAAAPKTAMEFPLHDKGYRYVVVMVPQTGIHNFASSIHGSSVWSV